jgi:anion-transporting  ArsA/GET3 family ATPase
MTLARLVFVTGKGGTGKSTVAAALALGLARKTGVTLADLDQKLSAARLLGVELNGGSARASSRLDVMALDPRSELEAFIERLVPIRAISRRMLRSRTFGYVSAALPGLEAFLMLERLRIMADDGASRDRYLVVDAPASGNALEMLSVARGVKGIAPLGTLNRLASQLESFLADPARFGVVLTVTPEEMALREAVETAARLKERLGIGSIGVVLNATLPPLFDTAELAALSAMEAHARLALKRNAIAEYTVRARGELAACGLAVIELPMLFRAGLGKAELSSLGLRLAEGFSPRR